MALVSAPHRSQDSGGIGGRRRKFRFRAEMRLIGGRPVGILKCAGFRTSPTPQAPPMSSTNSRRDFLATTLAAGAGLAFAPRALQAQLPDAPFRYVDPLKLSLDRGGVWTLHFAYLPPRIATVKVPGKGERTVWYMVYYVYNKTGKPRTIVPEFELVTKDTDGIAATFLDEPEPAVVEALKKIEDPTGELKLQTSISISKSPIPETADYLTPPAVRAVHGVAIWLNVPEKAPNVNNFSIYVSGLTDGLSTKETDTGKLIVSKKTLQLDFRRPTDSVKSKPTDIKINDNAGLGSERWDYREARILEKKPGK